MRKFARFCAIEETSHGAMLAASRESISAVASSESNIDARTALACTNVKAANIKIYTVRVIDGNATLLKNCASKANMYYEVTQADQLNSVFSSIA